MPDSTMSEALRESYASDGEDVSYLTIEFRHSLLPEPIRVVCDNDDLMARLEPDAPLHGGLMVRFQGYTFDLNKPEVSPTGVPQITVDIDNVDQAIVASIESVIGSAEVLRATFREYLSSDLEMPQNDPVMHVDVINCKADVFRVRAVLGWINFMNLRFPTLAYTSDIFLSLAE